MKKLTIEVSTGLGLRLENHIDQLRRGGEPLNESAVIEDALDCYLEAFDAELLTQMTEKK